LLEENKRQVEEVSTKFNLMAKERDSLSQELAQLIDLSVVEQQLLKNHFQQK
jgi:hypothetical protein